MIELHDGHYVIRVGDGYLKKSPPSYVFVSDWKEATWYGSEDAAHVGLAEYVVDEICQGAD